MDDAPMMRPAAALASVLATLLVACAVPAKEPLRPRPHPSTSAALNLDHPMTPAASSPAVLSGARAVADRVLRFLSETQSSNDFSAAHVGQRMGVTLTPDPSNGEQWTAYRSERLGGGWTYGVQQADARASQGRVFGFWFYNEDRAADPAPVCALPLDQLRASLTAHGWTERAVPSEIGSVLAIEFAKHDIVLTLTPRDIATRGPAQCVLSLLATGGH
ncbi:hypothetical protein P3W23_00895 [Luteibacter sp. PPL554]